MSNPLRISETAFQHQVEHLAHVFGWRLFHAKPAQLPNGRWVTNQSGDAGFPDLVLAHPSRGVIFAELKTQLGRITPGQRVWLNVLDAAGMETYIWRPSDFNDIKNRLMRGQK